MINNPVKSTAKYTLYGKNGYSILPKTFYVHKFQANLLVLVVRNSPFKDSEGMKFQEINQFRQRNNVLSSFNEIHLFGCIT